jgi:hypothetical protein
VRYGAAKESPRATKVDVQQTMPLFITQIAEGPPTSNPSVRNSDINRSEGFGRIGDERINRTSVSHVEFARQATNAISAHCVLYGSNIIRIFRVPPNTDVRPLSS